MADIKGDLTGVRQPGGGNAKIDERLYVSSGFTDVKFEGSRSRCGMCLASKDTRCVRRSPRWARSLSRASLQLNDTQEGVLTIAFKVADDNGLLLLDLKDLQSLLQFVGENADELTLKYGNVSKASVGAIQRGLLQLEQQGGAILW